jgi:hypothetical protein
MVSEGVGRNITAWQKRVFSKVKKKKATRSDPYRVAPIPPKSVIRSKTDESKGQAETAAYSKSCKENLTVMSFATIFIFICSGMFRCPNAALPVRPHKPCDARHQQQDDHCVQTMKPLFQSRVLVPVLAQLHADPCQNKAPGP